MWFYLSFTFFSTSVLSILTSALQSLSCFFKLLTIEDLIIIDAFFGLIEILFLAHVCSTNLSLWSISLSRKSTRVFNFIFSSFKRWLSSFKSCFSFTRVVLSFPLYLGLEWDLFLKSGLLSTLFRSTLLILFLPGELFLKVLIDLEWKFIILLSMDLVLWFWNVDNILWFHTPTGGFEDTIIELNHYLNVKHIKLI